MLDVHRLAGAQPEADEEEKRVSEEASALCSGSWEPWREPQVCRSPPHPSAPHHRGRSKLCGNACAYASPCRCLLYRSVLQEEAFLKRYIEYCRQSCSPRITDSAAKLLANEYVELRAEVRPPPGGLGAVLWRPGTVLGRLDCRACGRQGCLPAVPRAATVWRPH